MSDIQLALDFIDKNVHEFGITGSVVLAGENDGSGILHVAFDEWYHKNEGKFRYKKLWIVRILFKTLFSNFKINYNNHFKFKKLIKLDVNFLNYDNLLHL